MPLVLPSAPGAPEQPPSRHIVGGAGLFVRAGAEGGAKAPLSFTTSSRALVPAPLTRSAAHCRLQQLPRAAWFFQRLLADDRCVHACTGCAGDCCG